MIGDILLSEEISAEIDKSLSTLLHNSKTRCVLLLTRGGQIISDRGFKKTLQVHSLSALLTGVYNATSGLAKSMGEGVFTEFYLEGKRWNIYFRTVTHILLLSSIFSEHSLLGLVKREMKISSEYIQKIFSREKEISPQKEHLFKRKRNIDHILDNFFS